MVEINAHLPERHQCPIRGIWARGSEQPYRHCLKAITTTTAAEPKPPQLRTDDL